MSGSDPDPFGEVENARLLARDAMLYGTSFTDVTGRRIDPVNFGYPEIPKSNAIEQMTGPAGRIGPVLGRWGDPSDPR